MVALSDDVSELPTQLLSFITYLLIRNAIPQDNDLIESLVLRVLDQFANERTQPAVQMQNAVIDLLRSVPNVPMDKILAKAKSKP